MEDTDRFTGTGWAPEQQVLAAACHEAHHAAYADVFLGGHDDFVEIREFIGDVGLGKGVKPTNPHIGIFPLGLCYAEVIPWQFKIMTLGFCLVA